MAAMTQPTTLTIFGSTLPRNRALGLLGFGAVATLALLVMAILTKYEVGALKGASSACSRGLLIASIIMGIVTGCACGSASIAAQQHEPEPSTPTAPVDLDTDQILSKLKVGEYVYNAARTEYITRLGSGSLLMGQKKPTNPELREITAADLLSRSADKAQQDEPPRPVSSEGERESIDVGEYLYKLIENEFVFYEKLHSYAIRLPDGDIAYSIFKPTDSHLIEVTPAELLDRHAPCALAPLPARPGRLQEALFLLERDEYVCDPETGHYIYLSPFNRAIRTSPEKPTSHFLKEIPIATLLSRISS